MRIARQLLAGAIVLAVALVAISVLVASRPVPTSPLVAGAPGHEPATRPATEASATDPHEDGSPPTAEPGECLRHATIIDKLEPTMTNASRAASAVFVGEVVNVAAAERIVVPKGDDEAFHDAQSGLGVFRIVTLQLGRVIKGEVRGPQVQVRYPGGRIGCERYDVMGYPEPALGARFALFVNPAVSRVRSGAPDLDVAEAWPVTASGTVHTPHDGDVTLDVLEATAAGAAP